MSDAIETSEKKRRDIPLWLGILAITIGVAGAGWFVWSQVSGFWSAPSGVFKIEGVQPGRRAQGQPRQQQMQAVQQANIREINKTQWRVRAAACTLDVKQDAGKLNMTMTASSMRVLPADAQWVVVSRGRLDEKTGTPMGLSAAQIAAFKALPTSIRHELPLADPQVQQLRDSFQKYLDAAAAQKAATGMQVEAVMNQVATAATPLLTQRIQAAYDTFKKSITTEQWTKLNQLASAAPAVSAPN